MNQHNKINYLEFPAQDIPATKHFFETVFGWHFQDFGPNYTTFSNQGIGGGFFKSDQQALTRNGSALTVIFSHNLEQTQSKIELAGGKITQAIFEFPGGRRFHFTEPSGNELAVWSDSDKSL